MAKLSDDVLEFPCGCIVEMIITDSHQEGNVWRIWVQYETKRLCGIHDATDIADWGRKQTFPPDRFIS